MAQQPMPHAAYLAAPEVRDAIGMVLRRRGVPAVDAEDLTHDVIERALRTARPPQSKDECVLLVRKIASDVAIDAFKLGKGRAKYNAGPYENPDEAPAPSPAPGQERDPIDAARQLELVQQQIQAGNITARQASILASDAMDTPHAEIASQLNLATQTVRNELVAARRTVRASWAAYVATAVFGTVALVLWLQRDDGKVGSGRSAQDLAQAERQQALSDCAEQRWEVCLEGLDQAARLDPAGDSDPDIVKARADARKHLEPPP